MAASSSIGNIPPVPPGDDIQRLLDENSRKIEKAELEILELEKLLKPLLENRIAGEAYDEGLFDVLQKDKEAKQANLTELNKQRTVLLKERSEKQSGDGINSLLRHLIDSKYNFTDGKKTVKSNRNFKAVLIRKYHSDDEKTDMIMCCVLQVYLPRQIVIGSHLFKHEWGSEDMYYYFNIGSIDDDRNGLLMFKPIEWGYNNSKLCFLYNKENDEFNIKILDDRLSTVKLVEFDQFHLSTMEKHSDGDWKDGLPLQYVSKVPVEVKEMTFGQLNNKVVKFAPHTRPYFRVLYFHASRACKFAYDKKWISEELQIYDYWSDDEGLGWQHKCNILLYGE